MKAKSLKDLHQIQQKLAEQQRVAAAHEAARKETERRLHAERTLFVRAAGEVRPIRGHRRVDLAPEQPPPIAVQQQLDEQRVLREAISDEFDASTLLDIDDALSFRRPGIGTDVTRKLRMGEWSLQGEIDLHGLRREEAREALACFIRDAHRRGWRCVRVVHGKGLGSPGRPPAHKPTLLSGWTQTTAVLPFVQPRGPHGGAGALVVLLKPGVAGPVR
jgi:DNA-nicking Smr family endonuclease